MNALRKIPVKWVDMFQMWPDKYEYGCGVGVGGCGVLVEKVGTHDSRVYHSAAAAAAAL
jgi:hypothetical protein